MRNKIWDYVEENLKHFELDGVEITEMDIDDIEMRFNEFDKPLDVACDEVLQGIRDCLDEGL